MVDRFRGLSSDSSRNFFIAVMPEFQDKPIFFCSVNIIYYILRYYTLRDSDVISLGNVIAMIIALRSTHFKTDIIITENFKTI